MSEIRLLVTKPSTLNAADKKTLREAGIVVIECDNPNDVRFLTPTESLSSTGLLYAAMMGLTTQYTSNCSKEKFTSTVAALVKANFESTKAKP